MTDQRIAVVGSVSDASRPSLGCLPFPSCYVELPEGEEEIKTKKIMVNVVTEQMP